MKALVHDGHGNISLQERPMPHIQEATDAIVRVTRSTICTSDLHIMRGAVPRALPDTVLGHEFVGVIEEVGGDVAGLAPGDRVAVNCETFCGTCYFCKHGWVNNCAHGGWELGCRIDGCQAEFVRVPFAASACTPIPDSVSDEDALFLGDILATGWWGAKIAEIKPGSTVAVIGGGPVGIATMMCARLYDPRCITLIERDPARAELAEKLRLADRFINGDAPLDTIELAVQALTRHGGADAVIEAAGGSTTFEMAWRIARPNAVVVVSAMYEQDQILPLPRMYGKNLTFKTGGVDGCNCEEILRLIAEGRLNTEPLITHTYPLDRIEEAYTLFENKMDGVIKVAIEY